MSVQDVEAAVSAAQDDIERLMTEVGKVIVGQQEVITGVVTCLLAGGHALLEGVPGLGKTRLVRAVAEAMSLSFSRIQFTPDLMPADALGTNIITEQEDGQRGFAFQPGPIFAHIVLADEINRATPKTQSALLEAMQEATVTVAKTSHKLEEPFLVLATQNPLEMEGTYPLPEAQLDRFLLKLLVHLPNAEELRTILERTTTATQPTAEPVLGRDRLLELRELVRQIAVAPEVFDFAIALTLGTHPGPQRPEKTNRYVRFGSSPRGAQAMVLAAKVRALIDGRFAISRADLKAVAPAALRHRILLNFEGAADDVDVDDLLAEIIASAASTAP